MPRPLALLPILALAACGYVVPSTAARLATLDPLTADPAALSVAVVLPAGLRAQPGTALLTIESVRRDTGETRTLPMVLMETGLANVPVPAGATGTAYRLSTADVVRLRALQAEVTGWKAAGVDTGGSLGLGIGGCGVGEGPAPDAVGSAYIRTQTGAAFLPVIREAGLRDLLGPALFDAIGPCAGPG